MFGFGGNELIIVLLIVLVLFSASKVPHMMRGLGEGMKDLRKASREDDDERTPMQVPSSSSHADQT